MKSFKIMLFVLLALVAGNTQGQGLRDQVGRFDVAGYPGNPFPVVLTFPSTVPISFSVVSKYTGTDNPLPANRQPAVQVVGNTATVTFPFPRTAWEWQGYHEISWGGRVQVSGDIIARISNRNNAAPISTLLVQPASGAQIAISLIGGGGGTGVTAADIANVGDARYRKTSDPISWLTLSDRPTIPMVPTWLPAQDPGWRNETQVNALISAGLVGIQSSISQLGTDINSRVPFSTYTANRSTDQSATASALAAANAAQSTANNALGQAQTAQGGVNDVKTGYVPKTRILTFNGVPYSLDQDQAINITQGQAGVNSINGKNGNLTGFVESSDLTPYGNRITAVENGKVNAVPGLGLSSNDFTNSLLGKLNGVASGATNVTDNAQLANGAGYAKSADVNNWTLVITNQKQDKITPLTPLAAGNTSLGTLSVGSSTDGVITVGDKRISKSQGFPFQFEDGISTLGTIRAQKYQWGSMGGEQTGPAYTRTQQNTRDSTQDVNLGTRQPTITSSTTITPGEVVASGNITAQELHLVGATPAQTAEYSVRAFPGLGVRLAGNWIARLNGQLYSQSAGEVKTDGTFTITAQGRQSVFTSVGVHIGSNAAPSGALQVTGTAGSQFRITNQFTPSGLGDATGNVGQIEYDASNLYVKTTDGWERTPLYPLGTAIPSGGGGAVTSVNSRTGAVTGLAEASDLANYAPKSGVSNDFQVDGTFRIPTANDRWGGFDGLQSGQTTRFRLGDVTGAIDMISGQPLTFRGYHGLVLQNQSGGAFPAVRINGLSSGQNIYEFYDAANNLRARMAQDGTADFTRVRYPDGTVQTSASGLATAPVTVSIAADQTALLNAIAAATVPTTITWSGSITLTSDIELQNKSGLELQGYGRATLYRDNSPNMVAVRGGIRNCAIRGINFVNASTGSNGNLIIMNEQGTIDGFDIQYNTFVNTGSENNAISSNSSGGANDQFITSHRNIRIEYNKFGGAVMPGGGISRMAIELKNHSADGPGPIQYCERIYINYNEIWNTGTGSADGFGISLSGLFRYGTMTGNVIVDAKRYSLELVLVSDFVVEQNNVVDILNTSNGVSLSNGYKAGNALPAGSNRKIKVRRNHFNVKGRAILSYYVNNSEFTGNVGKSRMRNEWIGDENTITQNDFEVYNEWNAMYFAQSSRNRIVDNKASTFYHPNPDNGAIGTYTSSVIFFDAGSNNSYLRLNRLFRPTGSYNVHIEQASGVSNDTGAAFASATNTVNTYAENRPNTLGNDQVQVASYQDMINLGSVTVATTVYVLADEKNNGSKLSVYTILPNGKRVWFATVEDTN